MVMVLRWSLNEDVSSRCGSWGQTPLKQLGGVKVEAESTKQPSGFPPRFAHPVLQQPRTKPCHTHSVTHTHTPSQ